MIPMIVFILMTITSLLPLVVVTFSVMSKMVNPEDVNQNLYDEGLLIKEDPNIDVWFKQYNGPLFVVSLFVLLIAVQSYKMKKAF